VAIRTIRRDANESVKKLKTDKQISEDDSFTSQGEIQKLTDKHIAEIDALLKAKAQDLLAT
jgi:ribosome recycling factor